MDFVTGIYGYRRHLADDPRADRDQQRHLYRIYSLHNAGYSPAMAVFGSCLTTFAVCLPSFLLVLAISYAFAKFRNNKYVAAAFYGLRPATVGLIAAAALLLMNSENFIDYKSFLIFGAAFILTWKFKINPILMIILAGIAGIVLYW